MFKSIYLCIRIARHVNREHDMRVLLTLILAYIYFDFVIYDVRSPKFYAIRALASATRNHTILSLRDSNNDCESDNGRNDYLNVASRLRDRSVQRLTDNESAQVKMKKLVPQQHCRKNTGTDSRRYYRTSSNRIYRRKLLDHERNSRKHFKIRRNRMHQVTAAKKLTEMKRDVVAKDTEPNDEDIDSEAWDNWNNWSACSVTCGRGRQVRWRHCISENCIKGLKRAQMKSCHLKDCKKGFLSWFGIKT